MYIIHKSNANVGRIPTVKLSTQLDICCPTPDRVCRFHIGLNNEGKTAPINIWSNTYTFNFLLLNSNQFK